MSDQEELDYEGNTSPRSPLYTETEGSDLENNDNDDNESDNHESDGDAHRVDAVDDPEESEPPEASVVQFCSTHKVDLQPQTCNACRHVSRMVRPNVLKELVKTKGVKEDSDIPSAAARFCRSDTVEPTMVLSESTMDLAIKVFSLGKFKLPHHYENLTKELMYLPLGQNDSLTANLTLEPMFKKFEKSGQYRHVFAYKNQVVRVTRDLRVAQVGNFLLVTFN